jgi:hypothetical protein
MTMDAWPRAQRADLFEDLEAVSRFLEQRERARTGTVRDVLHAAERIVTGTKNGGTTG